MADSFCVFRAFFGHSLVWKALERGLIATLILRALTRAGGADFDIGFEVRGSRRDRTLNRTSADSKPRRWRTMLGTWAGRSHANRCSEPGKLFRNTNDV